MKIATGEIEGALTEDGKNKAAVALGSKGGRVAPRNWASGGVRKLPAPARRRGGKSSKSDLCELLRIRPADRVFEMADLVESIERAETAAMSVPAAQAE
jgi:hypothetical protein